MKLALAILFAVAIRAEVELPPNPPGFNLKAINLTDGASGAATGVLRNSPAYDAPVGQGKGIDTPTIRPIVTNILQSGHWTEWNDKWERHFVFDAPNPSNTISASSFPVRRWHGAMAALAQPQQIPLTGGSVTFVTPEMISVNGVVSVEELSRAVALRRTTIPPPMPPSTNTMQSAHARAMLEFMKHGPKDRPTIIPPMK